MNQNKITSEAVELLPHECRLAFKEWEGVCAALGSGRQVLIFRKGGVAEDRGVFVPDHDRFWLYPTRVHETEQGLREGSGGSIASDRSRGVTIELFARVERIKRIKDIKIIENLFFEHVWTAETIRKRFDYREPGLWCMLVRIYRSDPAWAIANDPAAAGCKTWVEVAPPSERVRLNPVLGEAEFIERVERIELVWNMEANREASN
jgi:hypothetical protein